MAEDAFPEVIGNLLIRQGIRRSSEGVAEATYSLAGEARGHRKYYPLRDTLFRVKRKGKSSRFDVLINGESFQEAFTAADVVVTLERAFDHECIRAGIESASARLRTSSEEEENLTRRRLDQEGL